MLEPVGQLGGELDYGELRLGVHDLAVADNLKICGEPDEDVRWVLNACPVSSQAREPELDHGFTGKAVQMRPSSPTIMRSPVSPRVPIGGRSRQSPERAGAIVRQEHGPF